MSLLLSSFLWTLESKWLLTDSVTCKQHCHGDEWPPWPCSTAPSSSDHTDCPPTEGRAVCPQQVHFRRITMALVQYRMWHQPPQGRWDRMAHTWVKFGIFSSPLWHKSVVYEYSESHFSCCNGELAVKSYLASIKCHSFAKTGDDASLWLRILTINHLSFLNWCLILIRVTGVLESAPPVLRLEGGESPKNMQAGLFFFHEI